MDRDAGAMAPKPAKIIYFPMEIASRELDSRLLLRARKAGYITAAIDEEIPDLIVHDQKFWWVSRGAIDATDLIIMPCTYNSSAFASVFGLEEGRVRRASNAHWDLLREELRPVFADDVAELKRRYGAFILVNSNLGLTNSRKSGARQMIQGSSTRARLTRTIPISCATWSTSSRWRSQIAPV